MNAPVNDALSPLGTLLLSWLLTRSEGGTPNEMDKVLHAVVRQTWTKAERDKAIAEALSALADGRLVKREKKVRRAITPEGRKAVLGALGVKSLPRDDGWRQIKTRYVLASALGTQPFVEREKTTPPAGRCLVVLARYFELPTDSTVEQIAAKVLGTEEVELEVLSRWIQGITPVRPAAAPEPPRAPVPEPPPPRPRRSLPTEDKAFAERILAAARASRTGRFGEHKVFISHVLGQLAAEGFEVEDAEGIKARLVDVHRSDLLTLSRADLVEAMAPEDVNASETQYRRSTFHFVRI